MRLRAGSLRRRCGTRASRNRRRRVAGRGPSHPGAEFVQAHDPDLEFLQLLQFFGLGKGSEARCHGNRQPISRLMTRASFLPAAGCSTGLVTYRSPLLGVACPLREIRASTTTLSNCESRREGIMAMESSR